MSHNPTGLVVDVMIRNKYFCIFDVLAYFA